MASSIKPVDTVRTAADLKPADLEGIEGRWLDIPRLQQHSTEVRSSFWCGRASAAMVYNYFCKAQSKTGEYVGHDEGEAARGLNGAKLNLRFMGGSNKGKLAGVKDNGEVHAQQLFDLLGWPTDSGELVSATEKPDALEVDKVFARHLEQLRKNNPVVQFTQLGKARGHVVVIGGYKKDSDRGELWLRIVDPDWPQEDLLGAGNFKMITRPEAPEKQFSEYWLKASRLLQPYPGRGNTRFYSHADYPLGYFFYVLPQQPVKDDSELVHKLGKGLGETAGVQPAGAKGKKKDGGKKKTDEKAGPEASVPPETGIPRLPVAINDSNMVTGDAVTSLYHQTERGLGGFFPLGDSSLFHCGAHITPAGGSKVMSMADGEVAAARIGGAPGEHPWGDTGFVLLRHKLKGDKTVYCLYLHLRKEPLHPDHTDAGWLKRLLISAMQGKEPKKPKWRLSEAQPTWKDEDKGKWSPVNVQAGDKLEAGVYEEDAEFVQDSKRYVKLKGKWIRATGPDGGGSDKVKEMSPWADFDLELACKNSAIVKDLRDGKAAVLDADKEDGKHKWKADAGETVGRSGNYLGSSTLHWSVFSKDSVFPSGSLPDKEFTADEQPKVADLDLSSKEAGTTEYALALIEAVDPDKKFIGHKEEESIIEPGELRHFYRTPSQCWRGRYQAVKGTADFALDLDKLVKQDRYKSHTDAEKGDFTKNGKAFLFWNDLGKVDDFPTGGTAVFVHPVTALRMMSQVRVEQDHDDPPEEPGANAQDRLHAGEDVMLVVRDGKGPLADVEVTVKADGAVVLKGKTDSQGEIILKIEDVLGKDIEVSVDSQAVGDKGLFVQVANETHAPSTLQPGDAPHNQVFNGDEVVPNPRMGLRMRVKKGAVAKQYGKWNAEQFQPEVAGAALEPDSTLTAERIVFRKEDGKWEAISFFQGDKEVFAWSIEDGEEKIAPDPLPEQTPGKKGDPFIVASWSSRIAHLADHPVVAGRVQNIADGTELEITFSAILAVGAPEHDHDLGTVKSKVAAGGFAAAFDPHQLTSDSNLLNAPRPVFAKVKAKDKTFSLRDQAVTVYGDAKFPDKPTPPAKPAAPETAVKEIVAWYEISRDSETDQPTGWSKEKLADRSLSQLTGPLQQRLAGDGWDKIWVGTCTTSQHLALETEAARPVADAMAHHANLLKTAFPDAPAWIVAADGASAWKTDNGIETGVCATDCKTSVNKAGKAAGCSESIRVSNINSCRNAAEEKCQKAIQPGRFPVVKSCPDLYAACGQAQHDKSKCFLKGAVAGGAAEERERWHVRLPMRTAGAGYPYLRDSHKNLRVLLVNPDTGAAVVCSQEARGPGVKCDGHAESPNAAVKADELKDKDVSLAASYETYWKLGLSRQREAVVLLAFVDLKTPLGPVADGVPIKLKKTAEYATLLGDMPSVQPGVPGDKVKSSNITVAGKPFPDWFNKDFHPQYKGFHETIRYPGKMKASMFRAPIHKPNFNKVFDNVKLLWAAEITLQEFVAIFCIIYNETGGLFAGIGERNGPKYMFEAGPSKASYNGILGNKKAGTQLSERGVITDPDQIAAWNSTGPYPDDSGIRAQVLETDFYKFRGHGLNQLTGRGNYQAFCDKHLKAAGYAGIDAMSGAELEKVIETDPRVAYPMFKSFFTKNPRMADAMAKANDNSFFDVGKVNAGASDYAAIYEWRCLTLLDGIQKAGFEFR